MGIVNINDDSFSGDGTLDIEVALDQSSQMVEQGADIIDVGAESARTNRDAINIQAEIDRLLPYIAAFPDRVQTSTPRFPGQLHPPLLSINSWRPEVIQAVLETGRIDIVNDIGGLPDATNAELCVEYNSTLLIMHTVGLPKVAHTHVGYGDVWSAVEQFFDEKIAMAKAAGLRDDQIILDPGIDFAKQRDDNLAIYQHAERLKNYGLPVLLPISRKTVIGDVLDLPEPQDRDAGTLACLARGISAGLDIYRVHDVKAAAETAQVLFACR
ncbi:MAG: dihydropteroate synthase [Verrucomicrobiota bacterium]